MVKADYLILFSEMETTTRKLTNGHSGILLRACSGCRLTNCNPAIRGKPSREDPLPAYYGFTGGVVL